jgi:lipooligosaccharide transport system ATP-binding protein
MGVSAKPAAERSAQAGAGAARPAVSLRGVVKRFGAITAVAGLDLEVPQGICLGLLGPNGAGKSTTMRMLTAQAIADEGTIEVLGWTLPGESKQARAEMGVVPQLDNLDVELTCRQILTVFARLYRVPPDERAGAVQRALQIANLTERAETRVDLLSGGMRRRLLIARGLVHRPRLVLLDEPTVGLDPQVRQELWSLIDALRAEGTTVLMSTHYIEEAERLADTVAVMASGLIVARGKPTDLVRQHAGEQTHEVYGPPARLEELRAQGERAGWAMRRSGPALAILRAELHDGTLPEGVRRAATLEDAFVALTGEEIE